MHVLPRLFTALYPLFWCLAVLRAAPVAGWEGNGFSGLPSANPSVASAISSDGNTIVGRVLTPCQPWYANIGVAHLWRVGAQGLPALEGTSIGALSTSINENSSATAVSADGSVVFGWSDGEYSQSANDVFRWTAGDGMERVGEAMTPMSWFHVHDTVADGSIAVGWHSSGGFTAPIKVRQQTNGMWDPWGGGYLPPSLDEGWCWNGVANGISADGSAVVGGSYINAWEVDPGLDAGPYIWTVDTGFELLAPGREGEATDVSLDGRVAVGWIYDQYNRSHGFRWSRDSGMIMLGELQGSTGSAASAVSGDGSVIVGSSGGTLSPEASIWDAIHGVRSLQRVLSDELGFAEVLGWRLSSAVGISADGRTIIGNGIDPSGVARGWIARIPEPASGLLLAAAAAAMFGVARPPRRTTAK